MDFEKALLKWVFLALATAIICGGTPWVFPEQGKYWIQEWKSSKDFK